MIRRLRFSLLSVFAAMLLLVSAAGWARFQAELYREEIDLLAALDAAGVRSTWGRTSDLDFSVPAQEATGTRPFLAARIDWLGFEGPAPDELRDRAARLPCLRSLGLRRIGAGVAASSSTALVDIAVPTLPSWSIDASAVDTPMTTGEPLSRDQIAIVFDELRENWAAKAEPIERYVAQFEVQGSDFEPLPGGTVVWIHDRDSSACFGGPCFTLERAGRVDRFDWDGADWTEVWRYPAGYGPSGDLISHFPAKSRAVPYGGPGEPIEAIVARSGPDVIADASRISETLVRFDLVPLADDGSFVPENSATRSHLISVLVRTDLDHAIEDYSAVTRMPLGPPDQEYRAVSRFRRIGDRVFQEEAVIASRPVLFSRERFAYDLHPAIDPAVFTPERYGYVSLPEPRPLPFWRWYRVTFAISLALFALLIGRSATGFFGRRRHPVGSAVEPLSAEKREPDERADSPTPGS